MAIVTTHVAAVQELYVAYFGRPADVAGLDYWTNVVQAQAGSLTAVSAAFAKEKEYTDLFTGLSNAQIVDKIYTNMFGHAADTAGRDYWVGLLTSNTITIDTVVAEVAKGAQGTDNTAIENKVSAATAFTNALDLPAEQAGYTGAAAAVLAKAFIAGVTTDATLAAAITPSALNATIAAVVAAGTPFTLVNGLAALNAADAARVDFLATLDLDDDEDTDTTAQDVIDALDDAYTDVSELITVGAATPAAAAAAYLDASATVKAALIQDQTKAYADALTAAEGRLADAQEEVAEVAGLTAAVADLESATDANATAVAATRIALANQSAAEVSYEVRTNTQLTIDPVTGATPGVLTYNATTGALTVASTVTAANRAAATELLQAVVAHKAAVADQEAAADALFAAQLEVNLLDVAPGEAATLATLTGLIDEEAVGAIGEDGPTAGQILDQLQILRDAANAETPGPNAAADLQAFENALDAYMDVNDVTVNPANSANNPLSTAVLTETAAVEAATGNIEDLAEAIAALEVAQGNDAELKALDAAYKAAFDAFKGNNYKDPIVLGTSATGTAGSDIFVLGDAMTTTISSFGRVGTDSLYIGTDYTLNTGALSTGNNAVLEVFFINSAAGVKVTLETEVFGSASAAVAEQVITLTGVTADQLQFVDGIISLKAAA